MKKISVKKIIARAGICLGTFLFILILGIFGAVAMIHYGPSSSARNIFTATVTETSAMKFLATWFLSDKIIDEIKGEQKLDLAPETTAAGLIKVDAEAAGKAPSEIIEITGRAFTGKLLIINDPKRVYIGMPKAGYGKEKDGVKTIDLVKEQGAFAGVNGGGFVDVGGKGNGGVPMGRKENGVVISGGRIIWGSPGGTYEIIGFNSDGILILGKMTAQKALDSGIKEALNFGPYLIINGKPNSVVGETESGLNPRTAIGQRKDGAVLLLVINGRQASSLGATYEDLIEIMMEYGAINAANLDGGSSSYMVYGNEIVTTCASLYGPRKIATSILINQITE